MSASLKSVGAITLFVDDPRRSQAFYTEVFDLPVIWEDEDSAVFQFENTIVNLLKIPAARELIEPGVVAEPRGRIPLPAHDLGRRRGRGQHGASDARCGTAQRPDRP